MATDVIEASRDHCTVIRKMLVPYLKELHGSDFDAEYKELPFYWTDPTNRFPFLIRPENAIAGFALLRRINNADHVVMEMAEFYVMPEYRTRRIGLDAATELFRRFPGNWKLEVIKNNVGALAFWPKVLRAVAQDIQKSEFEFSEPRVQFRFNVIPE